MTRSLTDSKPVLLPVRVPWQIDAATPFLRLIANESSGHEQTQVTAYAKFLATSASDPAHGPGVTKTPPPTFDAEGHALGNQSGAYCVIRCSFKSAIWAQMKFSFSDLEVVDTRQYEWSKIPVYSTVAEGIEISVRRFMDAWRASEFCPNPRMYEVENSPQVRELGNHAASFKHFLMLGHDAYVEIIAEDWKWDVA